MRLSQITPSNIKAFVEGYSKLFYNKIVGLPHYMQEQVLYRKSKCQKSCVEVGHKESGPNHCERCGCSVPGKWFVTESCNGGDKFPDLMGEEKWKTFKKHNDIKL